MLIELPFRRHIKEENKIYFFWHSGPLMYPFLIKSMVVPHGIERQGNFLVQFWCLFWTICSRWELFQVCWIKLAGKTSQWSILSLSSHITCRYSWVNHGEGCQIFRQTKSHVQITRNRARGGSQKFSSVTSLTVEICLTITWSGNQPDLSRASLYHFLHAVSEWSKILWSKTLPNSLNRLYQFSLVLQQ